MKLTLVMPAVTTRIRDFHPSIVGSLEQQIGDDDRIELLMLTDNCRMSIGRKMNHLVAMARGEYVAGVGDDDYVAPDYIKSIMAALDANPGVDVVCFDHEYWQDGTFKALIKEGKDRPYTNNWDAQLLTRSPSNKMVFRKELIKDFRYLNKWHGEDTDFAKWVRPKLETEVYIERVLYRYLYRMDNPEGKHFRRRMAKKGIG